jgi:hypothetical protein
VLDQGLGTEAARAQPAAAAAAPQVTGGLRSNQAAPPPPSLHRPAAAAVDALEAPVLRAPSLHTTPLPPNHRALPGTEQRCPPSSTTQQHIPQPPGPSPHPRLQLRLTPGGSTRASRCPAPC